MQVFRLMPTCTGVRSSARTAKSASSIVFPKVTSSYTSYTIHTLFIHYIRSTDVRVYCVRVRVRACVRACVRVTWCGRGAGSETVVGMEGGTSSAGSRSRQPPADNAGALTHTYKTTCFTGTKVQMLTQAAAVFLNQTQLLLLGLARAVYKDASVYLLDGVLSALEPQVLS
jgi:hypothetical protein